MGSFFGLMGGLCRGEVDGVVMGCVWLGGGGVKVHAMRDAYRCVCLDGSSW